MTPNDALMELLVMVDAAQGASAHWIISRDALVRRRARGQEVPAAPAAHPGLRRGQTGLQAVGVDRVLAMDLHSGQIQGFFEVPVDHMTAMPMLTQYFMDQAFHEERSSSRPTPAA